MISATCLILCFISSDIDTLSTDHTNSVPGRLNPAYVATLDSIIDPLEYGEPFATICGIARIGLRTFFIHEDAGDYWRLVILFRDKICVVQNNEPRLREFELDQCPRFIYSSNNGRIVASDVPCLPNYFTRITSINFSNGRLNEFMLPDDMIDDFTDIINSYHISNNDGILTYIPFNSSVFGSYHSLSVLGSVDTLRYNDLESEIDDVFSSSQLIQFDEQELSFREIEDLNSNSAEIANFWYLTHYIGRNGYAIGKSGPYVLVSTSNGIICFDKTNGQPIFTGMFDMETKNPIISPNGSVWVVEARPIVDYPQTCPSCYVVGNFTDPYEISVAYISPGGYWSDARILDISDNGRLLLVKSPNRNSRLFTLLELDGEIIWQSDTLYLFEGEYQLSHNYRTRATGALSADGCRLVFSDYSNVYVISFE